MFYDLLGRAIFTALVAVMFFAMRMNVTWPDAAPWILFCMLFAVIIGCVKE